MSEALLTVVAAGPHVTIQDGGRPGMARFGVPASGPMDRLAFRAANVAIGNPPDAPAIEVSAGGLVVECRAGGLSFAVAGGGFGVEHAGKQAGSWMTGALRAGERLALRPGHWGNWCYLALAGTLAGRLWLGSMATHAPSGLGGGTLRPGDRVTVRDAALRDLPRGPFPCPVLARPNPVLRVTLGPQDRYFPAAAVEDMQSAVWRVTASFDRMGTRLSGPAIAPDAALDMPSAPIARGSVQIAGDGVPTVLMADHQTTGGYPRIATVLDADLDGFAQVRPGRPVRFQAIEPADTGPIARQRARAVETYLAALARSRPGSMADSGAG